MRPKKHLGQHFLRDKQAAARIVNALEGYSFENVVEVGPGEGVLTELLLEKYREKLWLVEIDPEAVQHLQEYFPSQKLQIFREDFLQWDATPLFHAPLALIGNFPYNISSQILFRLLEWKDHIPVSVGMFQKEVADRVRALPGNKIYGILSVLVQAFYDVEAILTVLPGAFFPPPKVKSSVIRLVRREQPRITSDPVWFSNVVKTAFNQRRKTLRNALKSFILPTSGDLPFLGKRAEELSVEDFDLLARELRKSII